MAGSKPKRKKKVDEPAVKPTDKKATKQEEKPNSEDAKVVEEIPTLSQEIIATEEVTVNNEVKEVSEPLLEDSPITTAQVTESSNKDELKAANKKVKAPKPRWFFAASILAGVLLLAGGMYGYFGIYAQRPESLWKASLATTRGGLQALAEKGPSNKKGTKIDGFLKVKLPFVVDATLQGSTYEQSSASTLKASVAGLVTTVDVKTLPVAGSKTPDTYIKASGISNFAPIFGDPQVAALISNFDGKWLLAEHTLLDQLALEAGFSSTPLLGMSDKDEYTKDIREIELAIVKVMNDRLLSDEDSKAVFTIKDKLAKEDFEGRKSQHLRVQVRKEQLRQFSIAMKDALKGTPFNEWVRGTDSTISFEKAIGFETILENLNKINYDNSTADVWIDSEYKTIRAIRVYDNPSNTKSYTELRFDYRGGDEYPVEFRVIADNASGTQDIRFGISINQKSDDIVFTLSGTSTNASGQKSIDASSGLKLTPTDDALQVDKPSDAINISPLLSSIVTKYLGQDQLKVINPTSDSFLDRTVPQ